LASNPPTEVLDFVTGIVEEVDAALAG
jgi:hypothetical protein